MALKVNSVSDTSDNNFLRTVFENFLSGMLMFLFINMIQNLLNTLFFGCGLFCLVPDIK